MNTWKYKLLGGVWGAALWLGLVNLAYGYYIYILRP